MTTVSIWTFIVAMALSTYIIRALPILLLKKPITSVFLRSFLSYVPYAALGSMTFPAVFFSTGNTIASILGALIAIVVAWLRPNLLLVASAAVATAWLYRFLII